MPTIEQEITQLEKQIAEKRAALGAEGKDGKELPSEKEMLYSAVGERIQRQIPQYTPAPKPLSTQSDDDDENNDPSYAEPKLKDKVQEFVNVVFNKSLEEGIKNVSKSNNPALIDAFHDILADELYNMLVDRKKLEQIK
ncbi:MAG: hypothetical protein AAB461_01470 [Patescibacteria group bacterium]